MFKTIANAWKMPDIRKKILFTLLMLLVYRIGAYIPVPGVNVEFIANQVADYDVLGLDVYKRQGKTYGYKRKRKSCKTSGRER